MSNEESLTGESHVEGGQSSDLSESFVDYYHHDGSSCESQWSSWSSEKSFYSIHVRHHRVRYHHGRLRYKKSERRDRQLVTHDTDEETESEYEEVNEIRSEGSTMDKCKFRFKKDDAVMGTSNLGTTYVGEDGLRKWLSNVGKSGENDTCAVHPKKDSTTKKVKKPSKPKTASKIKTASDSSGEHPNSTTNSEKSDTYISSKEKSCSRSEEGEIEEETCSENSSSGAGKKKSGKKNVGVNNKLIK